MFLTQGTIALSTPGVLVFRSNVCTSMEARALCTALSSVPGVKRCTLDLEDCDKVLCVSGESLESSLLVKIVADWGLHIEELEEG